MKEKIKYDDFALKGNLVALGGNLWNSMVSKAIREKKEGQDDLNAAAAAFFEEILPEMQNFMEQKLERKLLKEIATRQEKALADLIAAARQIRAVNNAERAHIVEVQKIAAEARKTGKNLSHRIQPKAFDYGDSVYALLDALERYEKNAER